MNIKLQLISKKFNINNDILSIINEYYIKYFSDYDFWCKKYYFDQLFINYICRFNGKNLDDEYRPKTNIGNHYSNIINPQINYNSFECIKIEYMNLRYNLLNEIIFYKNMLPSDLKISLIDKKHYLDVEEYIDCTQFIYSLIPYHYYKYVCFKGESCIHCNRIHNYTNEFLNIQNIEKFI